MRLLVFISLLFSSLAYSQEPTDTLAKVQEIDPISITALALYIRGTRESVNHLKRNDIEVLQAIDIGELLQKFEGTSFKSYGGLGGLKTVSMRGLGSQHTAVCIDGFNLSNSQTGQVNLGQLQTDNVEEVVIGVGGQPRFLLPVTAQIAGSSLLIETFENSFSRDTFSLRSNIKLGSFGRFGGYGAVKWKFGKSFISAFGNAQLATGIYSYRFQNGFQEGSAVRSNNDYQDYFAGATYGVEFKKTRFRLGYRRKGIDQGLPGAVILYNSSADERLNTQDQTVFSDAMIQLNDVWTIRVYGSANKNDLHYSDPTYLNAQGFVDITYANRSVNSGIVGYLYKDKWDFHTGIESTLSDLHSTDTLFAKPVRQHYSALSGVSYSSRRLTLKGQLSTQFIVESNNNGDEASDKRVLNPYFSIKSIEFGRLHHRHQLWYKNSFRMPSFNELYYNNIGNNLLLPERADQFGYNLSFVPKETNLDWHIRVAGYYNRVRNKIVATPSKNLFVWSIQNIGKVDVYGGEIVSKLSYRFKKNRNRGLRIRSYITYSYQRSLNMTDPDHPTYKHQIAYIPEHTLNFDFAIEYKKLGARISNNYVGMRYSLNENIPTNEVDAFLLTDVSLYHKIEIGKKHGIRIQLSVKNVFNSSYAYIRSFVMPGRNYLISLSYAIN